MLMETDVEACFDQRKHMHDIPTTRSEVWDSYRETLESRRRSRAREHSHIPFDWHKDQSEKEVAAPPASGQEDQQQFFERKQQQHRRERRRQQRETEAEQQEGQAAAVGGVYGEASLKPHKPPAIPVERIPQQPSQAECQDGLEPRYRQAGAARTAGKPKQTASSIKVRREVPATTKSSTAQHLYDVSQRKKERPSAVGKPKPPARGRENEARGRPTAARSAANARAKHPARRNYYGYKPPIHEEEDAQPPLQQRQPRRGGKPSKKEHKPAKKRPPFAFYGWNNDQIGAWQNKKTFNVRASNEVDVHALHAALDRGYLQRLPKNAQREWAKPLHTHPFDYEQYQRDSGRAVEGDEYGFEAVDDDVYIASSGDGYRPSARMAAAPPPQRPLCKAAHATGKREERGVQWSPPDVEPQERRRGDARAAKRPEEEEAAETEPLDQHALTVTFESEPARDEEVQTNSSCLCYEDEATQTSGAQVVRASRHPARQHERERDHPAPEAMRASPRRQQQQQQRLQPASPKAAAGVRSVPQHDAAAQDHEQQRQRELAEAMRKVDLRQPPELKSEYRRAYGNWYHQMLLQRQQGQQPPFPQPAHPAVLDAHRPQVVQRRVAPRYHFDRRDEEDRYRVHYGAKYGGSLYC